MTVIILNDVCLSDAFNIDQYYFNGHIKEILGSSWESVTACDENQDFVSNRDATLEKLGSQLLR